MINFFKNLKFNKLKAKNYKLNAGMSYVELVVVLSIFSVLSSVVIFNYGDFQAKVDIKNLASDIALKIVEAQKSSLSGLLPTQIPTVSPWKPSYGVYFDLTDNKNFIYFTDLNNNNFFNDSNCNGECLNYITITKNNYISKIEKFTGSSPSLVTDPLAITFKRPDSSAVFSDLSGTSLKGFDYMQITITSPKGVTAIIKVYPSGRVQVN